MRRAALILTLCLLCSLTATVSFSEEQMPAEKQATLAALEFLQQVDRGEYQKCWQDSSEYFRRQIDRHQWTQEIAHLRPNFGENQQRQLQMSKPIKGSEETDNRPMLFLIFRSTFENKTAIEMVTLVKDPDNQWRVGGYSLQ